MNNKFFLTIILTFLIISNLFSQVFIKTDLEKSVNYLVDFVNSNQFKKLKETNSDLALVDTLYLRALKINYGNISETLLSLTFATLPFRKMPLRIPYLGITFDAKLPSGDPNLLKEKISNLPGKVFIDSPKTKFGDKDKVAHFFGNAYFAYSVSVFNISKFLSLFVELFEDTFKIQGAIDNRDLIANNLGYHFGHELKENSNLLPSVYFSIYNNTKDFKIEY